MPSLVERISSSTGALMLCVVWLVLPWIPWGPSAPVPYNTCEHTPRVPGALLHPSKLLVAPSLEDGGGNGLFVTAAVPNRTVLSFYCGTLLTLTQVIRSEDTSYCMAFGPNKHVDAGPHPEVLARYANHAFDEARRNAEFVRQLSAGVALLRSTRELAAGEEVLTDYGKSYWKTGGTSRFNSCLRDETVERVDAAVMRTPPGADHAQGSSDVHHSECCGRCPS